MQKTQSGEKGEGLGKAGKEVRVKNKVLKNACLEKRSKEGKKSSVSLRNKWSWHGLRRRPPSWGSALGQSVGRRQLEGQVSTQARESTLQTSSFFDSSGKTTRARIFSFFIALLFRLLLEMRLYVAQAVLEVTMEPRPASTLQLTTLSQLQVTAMSHNAWLPTLFDVKQAIKANFPSYKTGFTWLPCC